MIFLLFVILFFIILTNITKVKSSPMYLESLIKETHKYSGIHSDIYGEFLSNMNMAKNNMEQVFEAREYTELAVKNLNELALYFVDIDPDIQDVIAALGNKILKEMERLLVEEAINRNIVFRPKYI